jgi:hypothetical protein
LILTLRVSRYHNPPAWAMVIQLTLKPIYERGNEVSVLIVGIVATVVWAAGLLPPYAENMEAERQGDRNQLGEDTLTLC